MNIESLTIYNSIVVCSISSDIHTHYSSIYQFWLVVSTLKNNRGIILKSPRVVQGHEKWMAFPNGFPMVFTIDGAGSEMSIGNDPDLRIPMSSWPISREELCVCWWCPCEFVDKKHIKTIHRHLKVPPITSPSTNPYESGLATKPPNVGG